MERENEKLLKLYELAIREQHYFLDRHQSRIAFYSGILSALLAGTAAGLYKASESYQLILLLIGPPIIFIVSAMAITSTFRIYRLFLEAVTIRAKIEQTLGLTKASRGHTETNDAYWDLEAVIPERYIKSRKGLRHI